MTATLPRFDFSRCALPPGCTRRPFWVTQPDACGAEIDPCGNSCERAGLKFVDVPDCPGTLGCYNPCPSVKHTIGRTIATDNYAVGLALNILGTDGRRDETDCGYLPGRLGGHWSEAFMKTATARVGTRLRHTDYSGTLQQQVRSAEATAQFDLEKLVTYGVARSVDVTGTYKGSGRVGLLAVINGPTAELGRVGFNGSRVANAWVWQL